MNLAPIVIFVYNRLVHTKKTLSSLLNNDLAKHSDVYIFSDGAKYTTEEEKVSQVRNYLKSIKGFNTIEIIEREENWGLAKNIIDGVTQIVNEHGKIIVLEDDLIVSPKFLQFMNEALDYYESIKKVWHISGWNYPIKSEGLGDIFLWRVMNCYGWATWEDRWRFFKKDTEGLINDFSKNDIKRFNIDGKENFWAQVIANKEGKTNTWAIYWYATIFKKNGLCLNPTLSYVKNIGFDGSGVHSGNIDFFKGALNINTNINFNVNLVENKEALKRIQNFYISLKMPFHLRVIRKLQRIKKKFYNKKLNG